MNNDIREILDIIADSICQYYEITREQLLTRYNSGYPMDVSKNMFVHFSMENKIPLASISEYLGTSSRNIQYRNKIIKDGLNKYTTLRIDRESIQIIILKKI